MSIWSSISSGLGAKRRAISPPLADLYVDRIVRSGLRRRSNGRLQFRQRCMVEPIRRQPSDLARSFWRVYKPGKGIARSRRSNGRRGGHGAARKCGEGGPFDRHFSPGPLRSRASRKMMLARCLAQGLAGAEQGFADPRYPGWSRDGRAGRKPKVSGIDLRLTTMT